MAKRLSLFTFMICVVLVCSISCISINSTYQHSSNATKQMVCPQTLDFSRIDSNFIFSRDTAVSCYKTDAQELKRLVRLCGKRRLLCISFNYWCSGNRTNMDSILLFAKENRLPVVVLAISDWLYTPGNRAYFKSKGFYHPILILDIYKYGMNFERRRRWRAFCTDLLGKKSKLYGGMDVILFDSNANVLFCDYFFEGQEKLKALLND